MNPNWAIAAGLAVIAGGIFFALQVRRAQATVAAILRTEPTPEQQAPGTDIGLLIDAHLVYYGPAGLDQLRAAIDQTRKEQP